MGKYLVINGADFSANGIPVVDKLAIIKNAMEEAYYEHMRYSNQAPSGPPETAATNRSAWGMVDATDFPSFVVTSKSGYKIVPFQSDGAAHGKFSFEWTSEPVTFEDFSVYKLVGCNLSKGDNSNIPDGLSLWDFIDVALAE